MADRIYMNYRAMRQSASELDELADKLETLVKDEITYYKVNRNAWKGDSWDACREKLTRLESNLNKKTKELRKTANALRTAAEREYQLERAIMARFSG